MMIVQYYMYIIYAGIFKLNLCVQNVYTINRRRKNIVNFTEPSEKIASTDRPWKIVWERNFRGGSIQYIIKCIEY